MYDLRKHAQRWRAACAVRAVGPAARIGNIDKYFRVE